MSNQTIFTNVNKSNFTWILYITELRSKFAVKIAFGKLFLFNRLGGTIFQCIPLVLKSENFSIIIFYLYLVIFPPNCNIFFTEPSVEIGISAFFSRIVEIFHPCIKYKYRTVFTLNFYSYIFNG